jgi:hypothetical protein
MNWGTIIAVYFTVLVFDGVLAAFYFAIITKSRRVENWPSVPGTITTSRHHTGAGTKTRSGVWIEYSYSVNGQEYKCQQIEPGVDLHFTTTDLLQRYPLGAAVTVYYDPQNPQDAVLRKKSSNLVVLPVLITLILVLGCCGTPVFVYLTSNMPPFWTFFK